MVEIVRKFVAIKLEHELSNFIGVGEGGVDWNKKKTILVIFTSVLA